MYVQLRDHKYGESQQKSKSEITYKNIFQNLRLKLSDIEDVVCASASRPEELAGQQVRIFWSFLGLGSQS